jgi:hypothetical protein
MTSLCAVQKQRMAGTFAVSGGVSRRGFLGLAAFAPFALRVAEAAAARAEVPAPALVLIDGWTLRADDLARLGLA